LQDFNIMEWFLKEWLPRHGSDVTRPVLDKVIAALKAEGVTKFGGAGYCFGGRYLFDLAFDDVLTAGVTFHPSMLSVPADIEVRNKGSIPRTAWLTRVL
jgi:dienelactone hydrolase